MNVIDFKTINEVVAWRLCIGCGVCAYACTAKISLFDFENEGIRPVAADDNCGECRECLMVCPAVETDFSLRKTSETSGHGDLKQDEFKKEWGDVVEVWEGYATDPELRFKGSSGGVLTALSLYCIEKGGMSGVLHIGEDPEDPVRNRTRLSTSRGDLLRGAGSRYSPAAVGNGLQLVEGAESVCAIIGKPAEIAGIDRVRKRRPELATKIGVLMSFFCAESPSTAGTVSLLKRLGYERSELASLRYRGFGWPGHFAPIRRGATDAAKMLSYEESWAFLQAYRPWSVNIWPDGTGELADITCGDPWYEKPDGKNPGFSLIVVRSPLGASILRNAAESGYLKLQPSERWKLGASQAGLLRKKGEVGGRRAVLGLFGLPRTRFIQAGLFHCWRRLHFKDKVRSIVGTVRRILMRNLSRPMVIKRERGVLVKPALCGTQLPTGTQ